jgi:RimJ/RimL family protein N-acetyltransferase
MRQNSFGQPIGFPVSNWSGCSRPPRTPMIGRYCRVESLDVKMHAEQLYSANSDDMDGQNWTYLSVDPPRSFLEYLRWLTKMASLDDPMFHVIMDTESNFAAGVAAFMRIDTGFGVIEVGHINFSPRLKKTRAATESMYLMMKRAFDELGYRRYEWKCDSLNVPSRAAAERYGFQFEGVFRQAVVYKGRNRDTAWYSIIDSDWPAIKAAFENWLSEKNFDTCGSQRNRLSMLTKQAYM